MIVRLAASAAALERFPGVRIAVAAARGIDNASVREDVDERWHRAWRAAAAVVERHANAQSHPNVRAWRDAFRNAGIAPREFPSSVEALLRRAMKGGRPFSINPLVDAYNAVSLERVLPVGGFDLDALDGEFEVRVTGDGDRFLALDAEDAEDVPAGEVAYTAGNDVLTRHLVWRQSRRGLISTSTRAAVLLSEVLPDVHDDAETVARELARSLEQHFGVAAVHGVVDASASDLSLVAPGPAP